MTGPSRTLTRVARMRRIPLALVLALLGLTALPSCSPADDEALFRQRLFSTPLDRFAAEWRAEHARLVGVPVAVVESWWAQGRHLEDARAARGWWDITTDFCSFAPDAGPYFDFREACVRHDAGWRNLRRLDRNWNCPGAGPERPCGRDGRAGGTPGRFDTSAARREVNAQFGRDLRWSCARRPPADRARCLTLAVVYLRAVDLAT